MVSLQYESFLLPCGPNPCLIKAILIFFHFQTLCLSVTSAALSYVSPFFFSLVGAPLITFVIRDISMLVVIVTVLTNT